MTSSSKRFSPKEITEARKSLENLKYKHLLIKVFNFYVLNIRREAKFSKLNDTKRSRILICSISPSKLTSVYIHNSENVDSYFEEEGLN